MIRKIALVAAITAAGMALFGGMASATQEPDHSTHVRVHHSADDNELANQAGLVNLNNLDLLHNVNVVPGICKNNINVLGIQVPIQHALNGIGIPVLSPGQNEADGGSESCAAGSITDGGTYQGN